MKKESDFKEEYVTLAGIEHYLLHYQTKPENPVLLFIHGGPGQSESMMAYVVEEYEKGIYARDLLADFIEAGGLS